MSYDEKTTTRLDESGRDLRDTKVRAVYWLRSGTSAPLTPLDRPRSVVGRATDVDVCLASSGLSRYHAELLRDGGSCQVRDLDSTNGTFVNGQRVRAAPLAEGDVLRLGDVVGLVVRVGRTSLPIPPRNVEVVPGILFGPLLAAALGDLQRVASSDLPVVLVGATGVGKECVARALHVLSRRRGPFQAVNCAALPPSLAEAELFGHRRGAFTGAEEPGLGHFRAAAGGTLLLDELSDLPPRVQPKLLRALQEGTVTPLGETRALAVDVRIVAACQEPLEALVASRRLRPDLAARLDGVSLTLPPLCQRRLDLALLFAHFLQRYASGRPPEVDAKLLERLLLHSFPGNVRELELLTRRLLVLHAGEPLLRKEFLPSSLRPPATEPRPGSAPGSVRRESDLLRFAQELQRLDGNVTRAAEAAGISRQRAYRLLAGRSADELVAELGADEGPA